MIQLGTSLELARLRSVGLRHEQSLGRQKALTPNEGHSTVAPSARSREMPRMSPRFADLIRAYLDEHLQGKASYHRQLTVAKQWLLTLEQTPTRAQIRDRHKAKGHGDFQPGAAQANTEFMLLRAAVRWGIYQERWHGDDPTVGVKKWKTKKRRRVSKREEIKKLLAHFAKAQTFNEIRNRALFGLMLFTGCRPGEARCALLRSILPYGEMGCWNKGKTKNGEEYEVPVPAQYRPWLDAWMTVRPSARPNPYLFPGQGFNEPLTEHMLVHLWHDLRLVVGLQGLWNYDLRRSLATHMINELKINYVVVEHILGHELTGAKGHYMHISFDAMCEPIQAYADWLCGLHAQPSLTQPSLFSAQEVRA